ncbi:MAG: ligase-associated DNA damage response DEXH box helicase [Magnetovibrionaceae bacterium]
MESDCGTKLPPALGNWFQTRGWSLHEHQRALLRAAVEGEDLLLVAPTGGGKTLAGFLPSLVDLCQTETQGLHTLYLSPLKALAADVERNLTQPVAEAGLPIRIGRRTGDTKPAERARQRKSPPDILLTTPESLALMLSYGDAPQLFRGLKRVIVDEVHALAGTKRGDQLCLCLSALAALSPEYQRIGLSATVADPEALTAWLAGDGRKKDVRLVTGAKGAKARVRILETDLPIPWSGHSAAYAVETILAEIDAHETTLVFVNTRAQAEALFQRLWRLNENGLAIALHHGSLDRNQRIKVEAAMAAGHLDAVVCTSSLDLGIDWAAVDLVIQVGAPKGASRLVQRIGRAGHRLDEASEALLIPANRFEVLECRAAVEAIEQGTLDGQPLRPGGLDVLAQHILLLACSAGVEPENLYAAISTTQPYADLDRETFNAVFGFCVDGGYALQAYDQWKRLEKLPPGRYRINGQRAARAVRMNVGTIVEAETLRVKLKRGPTLGSVEEYFVQGLTPGDTFLFAGQVLRFEGIRQMTVEVTKAHSLDPKVPAYAGGRMPFTTHLASRVRAMLADQSAWSALPSPVAEWLSLQAEKSGLPDPNAVLAEVFPRAGRWYLVVYSFAGRNAHQTLGLLLTRRMEQAGLKPIGFVASDYAIAVWSVESADDVGALLCPNLLDDEFQDWLEDSQLLKRTFRNVAVIAGLIQRNHPGSQKTGRQVTFNSDLIYNTLRRFDPDHVLLRATRADAMSGLVDLNRLADLLEQAGENLEARRLPRVSPLAVPILLEVGKEPIHGEAIDFLMDEAAQSLIAEACG